MEVWATICLAVILTNIVSGTPLHDAANKTSTKEDGSESGPVVRIRTQGLFRGRRAKEGPYYEYLGIPYATASPETRFKSVLPVPTWKGIREGNDADIQCPQRDGSGRVVGTEDCLVLDVFTPENSSPLARLPVMVYIYGGRFVIGSNLRSRYGPERFMKEGVIIVTFNYRLGILGFLCMDEFANAGVKDAAAVLKWVQANIELFGGDPSNVTIFGNSSGAAMVDLLVLSKKTKGLFSGAISQSGLVKFPDIFENKPEEKAFNIGKKLGFEGRDRQGLLHFFRNASVAELVMATESLPVMSPLEFCAVCLCIEPPTIADALISSDPLTMIRSGDFNDIPYILGMTSSEGLMIYDVIRRIPTYLDFYNKEFFLTIPKELRSPNIPKERVVEAVKNFYFNGKNISNETMKENIDYFSDMMILLPLILTTRSYARSGRTSPLYVYEFAYDGGLAFLKRHLNIMSIPGVCHADELGYLFKERGVHSDQPDDRLAIERILKLWTNFAKFRDPTREISELVPVKWEPTQGEDLKYLFINRTMEMGQKPFETNVDFWDRLYKNYSLQL